MPRKAKSTQPVLTPTGLPYGTGKQLQDAQRAVPLPRPPTGADLVQAPMGGPGQGTPGPPPAPQGAGGGPPMEMAMQQASNMAMNPEGLLAQPGFTEPLTTGLPMGPGAGPEVLRTPDRTDLWHELARVTGDSRLLRLAMRARTTR